MKKVLALVVAVMMLCSFSAFAADKLVIGFSQIGAESAWRAAETASIQETAKELGIDLKFVDAQQKQENQIKAIRSFIAQGVNGIILAPVVATGWEQVLQEAKDAKIPVVLVDRGIEVKDDSLYTTLISSDFIFEGKEAAKWVINATKGKGNVVELQGTVGASAATERKKGFEEGIKGTELKIIYSQSGDFTRAGGKQVMEAALKAHKDINVVYAHNDDMALGAIEAIKAAGLKPAKDILIISIDAVKGAFEAMVAGELNATVECNPLLGPLAFDAIQKAIKGEKLPKWIQQVDNTFTMETAAEDIKTRKY